MNEFSLGAAESRFADIIWKNEPRTSSELSILSEKEIGWKKRPDFNYYNFILNEANIIRFNQ